MAPGKAVLGAKARTGLLARAERVVQRLQGRALLLRVLASWREPTWRSRRAAQKAWNVVAYRVALRLRTRALEKLCLEHWRSSVERLVVRPPPGLVRQFQ